MRQFQAFLKKEWMEQLRSNRFAILLVIFLLFGVLSPALAKLTPWLFSMLSQDLKQQGIVFTEMNVDALTSWMQFYKNITLLLIVMVVMLCTTLSNELQKGTLVNMITKGLARWKVLLAKESMMMLLWTIAYGLCFVVTTLYTAYFWDNSIAVHFVLAGLCIWVFGLWLIASILFFLVLCHPVRQCCWELAVYVRSVICVGYFQPAANCFRRIFCLLSPY